MAFRSILIRGVRALAVLSLAGCLVTVAGLPVAGDAPRAAAANATADEAGLHRLTYPHGPGYMPAFDRASWEAVFLSMGG